MRQLPGERDFGLSFDYSVWTANSVVSLHNVSWNNDYRDVTMFADSAALDAYLENQPTPKITITNVTYLRAGAPVRLQVPFNVAYRYNYLRAFNPAQPTGAGDTARAFYYFITDVQYVNASVTQLTVQLDIFQTFIHDVTFGNCYIESGHVGIANQNAFLDHGREFLTIPEGLDVGNEYQIMDRWAESVATARGTADFSVMVVATGHLSIADPGTVDKPKFQTATGSEMENLPNGAEIYLFNRVSDLQDWLDATKEQTWLTQSVISIMAIPSQERYSIPVTNVSLSGVTAQRVDAGSLQVRETLLKANWRDDVFIPPRYAHLKKFWTFPYMVLELTTNNGTPVIIKPENWDSDDATIVEVPHFAPPSARIAFYPYRYNHGQNGVFPIRDAFGLVYDGGEHTDMATGIANFPQFSIVNNSYIATMAGMANSLAFQHSSADWSQQKALQGNQLSYDQASAGMSLSQNLNAMQVDAATQSANLANEASAARALVSGGTGAISGVMNGKAGDAIGSVANAGMGLAIEVAQRNQQLGISNNLSRNSNSAQVGNAGYVRDTNKSFADYAAKGDYQNAIAGISARVQDAKLAQPTTSGQMGGDSFNLSTYFWGYEVRLKMLQPAAMRAIGEYWLRYGYKVQTFGRMPSDFHVMTKFTYWKLRETYITSSACPELFKQALRGIFEKGVTVWKNPNDIGNIDLADNEALEGIFL